MLQGLFGNASEVDIKARLRGLYRSSGRIRQQHPEGGGFLQPLL
ncbi:MAG: hypothetical protein RLZZ387_3979 [Chloroflexota bacterium]|jgi:hypothetical protein